MALPVAKGVIIVGGIAIAVGAALWEHEPFREWAQDTWHKTSTAFQGFADDLESEFRQKRREAPFSAMGGFAQRRGRRRRRSSAAESRKDNDDHEMRSPSAKRRDSGVAADGEEATRAERANDVSVAEQNFDAELRSRHGAASQTTRSQNAGPSTGIEDPAVLDGHQGDLVDVNGSASTSHDPDLQHLTREEIADVVKEQTSQHHISPRPTPSDINIDALHSHTDPYMRSRRTSTTSSIDIVSAPGSAHPGSERDDISNIDMMSDSGTETMSQISELEPISEAEGALPGNDASYDGDDVASVASSWSEIESVRSHEQ